LSNLVAISQTVEAYREQTHAENFINIYEKNHIPS